MNTNDTIWAGYTPRPYHNLVNRTYGYTTALWRQTYHYMGTTKDWRDRRTPVWAEVRLGYGIGAQNLRRCALTTDHTVLTDPIELTITFDYRDGGGAMGKSVLDIIDNDVSDQEKEIAAIAERWHLNGLKSQCDCMTLRYNVENVPFPQTAPSHRQRCIVTELTNGSHWWHEPLPQAIIDQVCSWTYEERRNETTIINGRLA
jgi:hypothetical protein